MNLSRIKGEITVNLEKIFELLPKSIESFNIIEELSEFLCKKHELLRSHFYLGNTFYITIDNEKSSVNIDGRGEIDLRHLDVIAIGLADFFEGNGVIYISEHDNIEKSCKSELILENKKVYRVNKGDIESFRHPVVINKDLIQYGAVAKLTKIIFGKKLTAINCNPVNSC